MFLISTLRMPCTSSSTRRSGTTSQRQNAGGHSGDVSDTVRGEEKRGGRGPLSPSDDHSALETLRLTVNEDNMNLAVTLTALGKVGADALDVLRCRRDEVEDGKGRLGRSRRLERIDD